MCSVMFNPADGLNLEIQFSEYPTSGLSIQAGNIFWTGKVLSVLLNYFKCKCGHSCSRGYCCTESTS